MNHYDVCWCGSPLFHQQTTTPGIVYTPTAASAIPAPTCTWTEDEEGNWSTDCAQEMCPGDDPDWYKDQHFCYHCGRRTAFIRYHEPPVCPDCGETLTCMPCGNKRALELTAEQAMRDAEKSARGS